MMIGEFKHENGEGYFMVVNWSLEKSENSPSKQDILMMKSKLSRP